MPTDGMPPRGAALAPIGRSCGARSALALPNNPMWTGVEAAGETLRPYYRGFSNLDRPFFLTAWRPGLAALRWADPAVAFEHPAMTWLCLLPYCSSLQSEGAPSYLLTRW